ncbi:hypothetical protein B6D02_10885, partial [Gilliamella apicola]
MKIIITIMLFFVVSILVFIITSLMGYFNKAFMPEFVSYLKLITLIIIFFCFFGFIFLRLFH